MPPLKLPTPATDHLAAQPVYPPSEDSFLLLDAFSLPSSTAFFADRFPPSSTPSPLLVEIGSGSGIVSAFLAAHALPIFSRRDILTLALDVSLTANSVTHTTVTTTAAEHPDTAATFLDTVTSDLASCLRPRTVDILVFNPPYVPTEAAPSLDILRGGSSGGSDGDTSTSTNTHRQRVLVDPQGAEDRAMEEYLLSLTYAGGEKGMQTTDRLLDGLHDVLSEQGVLYLLLCAGNRPAEVVQRVEALPAGWRMELVIERRAGWEILSIWRIYR
ncbi:hypothetical protein DRE_06479 [Drechslerella stenobrocha 248]|uniref:Methyltransferase small domain-containing protein n=1 Tax=Drechslerella stenobrocha 248 TaxID=1043628 RepID=W7HL38_9PEZI|nr:hypothetical protein DRE_06479 [Drechslerella stenobrocha 248]